MREAIKIQRLITSFCNAHIPVVTVMVNEVSAEFPLASEAVTRTNVIPRLTLLTNKVDVGSLLKKFTPSGVLVYVMESAPVACTAGRVREAVVIPSSIMICWLVGVKMKSGGVLSTKDTNEEEVRNENGQVVISRGENEKWKGGVQSIHCCSAC